MAVLSPVLPRPGLGPYRPSVPHPPKRCRIDSVSIEPLQPKGYLLTSPNSAVPSRFEAHFTLGDPEASVTIEVFVHSILGPVVVDISIRARADAPITTSLLRRVLVDHLLRSAVREATVPPAVRTEWLASLPASAREAIQATDASREPHLAARERASIQFDEDARTAAELYQKALDAGSRAPTLAVARAMNRSRSQASRYIRRARALDMLPPSEQAEDS